MTVAYAIAAGVVVIAVLYAVSFLLDELATRNRLRRMADGVRRRQLEAEHERNGVRDHRPRT